MTSVEAPSDGYRVKVNLRRALATAPGILNPVARHEQFLEFVLAFSGPGFRKNYERFRTSAEGQVLLRERPVLADLLQDEDRLRSAPPGSLGHAYLDFMSYNRLDAALYGDGLHDLPAIADRLGWDEEFTYVINRGIAAHDLMHVLGGYGPDIGGEFGVLAFTHGQVGGLSTGGTIGLAMAVPLGVPRSQRLRWWKEGVQRGRAADLLFAVHYETIINEPLDDVRRRLWIRPSHQAHPHGHMYSGYQFGTKRTRWMDEPFEPYEYDPTRDLSNVSIAS